jgi:6-phosphogluconate dehydrogenase
MDIGLYGLGRMGGNMVTRLLRGGHRVVAGNRSAAPVDEKKGEGFELLHASEFGLDMKQVASVWLQGSVVRSWLLELAERAFEQDGSDLANIKGWVADSGEGRWTVIEAINHDVPATVLAHSLFARFTSRQEDSYAMKVAAALRNQFGGHAVKTE